MHDGQDLRRKPYVLFRIKTDSQSDLTQAIATGLFGA
jgi:hypothetical protein